MFIIAMLANDGSLTAYAGDGHIVVWGTRKAKRFANREGAEGYLEDWREFFENAGWSEFSVESDLSWTRIEEGVS